MDNKDKVYKARARCRNCQDERIIELPFGIPMAVYEQKVKCDYCGCDCILVPLKEV